MAGNASFKTLSRIVLSILLIVGCQASIAEDVSLNASLIAYAPDTARHGESILLVIGGSGTHFLLDDMNTITRVWLSKGGAAIEADSFEPVSETMLIAAVSIPGNAAIGKWDINVEGSEDGRMRLPMAVKVVPYQCRFSAWGMNTYGQLDGPTAWSDIVQVAAGYDHSIALKADGSLEGAGRNDYKQASVPDGNDFVAVGAGEYFSVALKADGSLAAWGSSSNDKCKVPAGNDFVAISVGQRHGIALKVDGTPVVWGSAPTAVPTGHTYRAIAAGSGFSVGITTDGQVEGWGVTGTFPTGNDFVDIAAGAGYCVALRADGSLVEWSVNSSAPRTAPAGNDFVAVAARDQHLLALKADSSVIAWGRIYNGATDVSCPSPAGGNFVALSAGYSHDASVRAVPRTYLSKVNPRDAWQGQDVTVTVKDPSARFLSDGDSAVVRVWLSRGAATIDATGFAVTGDTSLEAAFAIPGDAPLGEWAVNIENHVSGNCRLLAAFNVMARDCLVTAWGFNDYGQCDLTPPDGLLAAMGASFFSLGIKPDGSLAIWGEDTEPFLSDVPRGRDYIAVDASNHTPTALKADGSIIAWGFDQNQYGELLVPTGNDFAAISSGYVSSIALKADGSLVGWGYNHNGVLDIPAGNDFAAVATSGSFALALKKDGSLQSWGTGSPGNMPAGNDFVAIAAGGQHAIALRADGTLVAWGMNNYGQRNVPAGADFVAIEAELDHCLALRLDGDIVGWGFNSDGQATPPAGNRFVAITAGYYHGIALKAMPYLIKDPSVAIRQGQHLSLPIKGLRTRFMPASGGNVTRVWLSKGAAAIDAESFSILSDTSIMATFRVPDDAFAGDWDTNVENAVDGRLWLSATVTVRPTDTRYAAWYGGTSYTHPVMYGGVAIDAGNNYTVGLKYDGSLVGWRTYPTPIPAGNNFVAVDAGPFGAMALRADGSVAAWGSNTSGQCNVPAGLRALALSCGNSHNVAIKTNGSLSAWGDNTVHQCRVPEGGHFVAIAAMANLALRWDGSLATWGDNVDGLGNIPAGNDFVAISAGFGHALALKADGSLVAWGKNNSGQCNVPAGNDFVAISAYYYSSMALKTDGSVVAWGDNTAGQCNVPSGNDFIGIAMGWGYGGAGMRQFYGDFNRDMSVNYLDFAMLAARWQQGGCGPSDNWCSLADVDSSGTIEFGDLERFARYWLLK